MPSCSQKVPEFGSVVSGSGQYYPKEINGMWMPRWKGNVAPLIP